jgi:hypothetical protein
MSCLLGLLFGSDDGVIRSPELLPGHTLSLLSLLIGNFKSLMKLTRKETAVDIDCFVCCLVHHALPATKRTGQKEVENVGGFCIICCFSDPRVSHLHT